MVLVRRQDYMSKTRWRGLCAHHLKAARNGRPTNAKGDLTSRTFKIFRLHGEY
jgi:hypothetical protein